jgi:hypothetical protein
LGTLKASFVKMKISPGWLKQNIFLTIKNASQKILTNFFVSEVFINKCNFQYAFDDNFRVTYVFKSKSSGLSSSTRPPFPLPPTGLCRGWDRCSSFHPLAAALVMVMKQ